MHKGINESRSSISKLVWVAIQEILQSNVNNEFKRAIIRESTEIKEGSFGPVFPLIPKIRYILLYNKWLAFLLR